MTEPPLVGVLAVQGAFVEHEHVLGALGVRTRQVRTVDELRGLDGLVIPGGESTTFGLVAHASGLLDGLRTAVGAGLPTFGTCAGLIMLARATTSGAQTLIGTLDVVVRRNAFGRQVASFEAPIDMPVVGSDPVEGIFIRAPWVESCGPDVEVLATYDAHIVAVRQDSMLAVAFHPELSTDTRVHALFVEMVAGRRAGDSQHTAGGSARVRA